MLRDERLHSGKTAAGLRIGIVFVTAAAGLAAVSLRGTASDRKSSDDRSVAYADDSQSKAAPQKKPAKDAGNSGKTGAKEAAGSSKAAAKSEPFSLAWIPGDAAAVGAVRPRELLNRPVLESIKKLLNEEMTRPGMAGISPDRVEHVLAVMLLNAGEEEDQGPSEPGLIVRLVSADDATALFKSVQPNPESVEHSGKTYVKGKDDFGPVCFQADARTVVICRTEEHMRRSIAAGKDGASKSKWAESWKPAATADAALFWNTDALRGIIQAGLNANPEAATQFGMFAPFWESTTGVILSLDCSQDGRLVLTATAKSPKEAQRVKQTVEASVTLGKNTLSQFRQLPGAEGTPILRAVDLGTAVLDSVKTVQTKEQVRAEATIKATDLTTTVAMMVPAVTAAREAARRSQSKNNLKQLVLALHNYESANNAFPPPVLYGPDGKTPYSWRVAILPYLDANSLYEQYKFDEPWDGPNNKQLLVKMPPFFRDPNDAADSTNTSYFAMTGASTVFYGKNGTKMAQVTDGTSNTVMLVEGKRDIPWTKPEDIPYDKDKPLPKLGGHYSEIFLAAMSDGAVRAISQKIDPNVLRALFTRDGGEVVNLDDLAEGSP